MTGRVTAAQRETMFRLATDGVSHAEIMKRLNIWDIRTLKRNLKIAEEEVKLQRVRERQLEEAIAAHMIEIRELIKRWKDNIHLSEFAISVDALISCRTLERERLFNCIKEHLPFESLWRIYEDWKDKHVNYVGWGKRLLEDVLEQGEVKIKLGRRNYYYQGAKLTEKFANPMVERFDALIMGEEPRAFEFSWREVVGEEGQLLMALYVGEEDVMVVEGAEAKDQGYERRYQEIFDDCVENHLKKLFTELSALKDKIEAELEDVLIHRSYIEHQCKLCPGRELK